MEYLRFFFFLVFRMVFYLLLRREDEETLASTRCDRIKREAGYQHQYIFFLRRSQGIAVAVDDLEVTDLVCNCFINRL